MWILSAICTEYNVAFLPAPTALYCLKEYAFKQNLTIAHCPCYAIIQKECIQICL